jgi:phosphohistidine swiveling domain-containing protein
MNLVRQYIERSAQSSLAQTAPQANDAAQDTDAELPDSRVLVITVQRARNFMRLKEEAKHYCLIELAQIRRLLLAIDEKCQLGGRVFQLHIDEVIQLADSEQRHRLAALADQRFEAAMAWKSLQLPASLSISDLERIDMLSGTRPDAVEQTELSGKRVAGEQEVIGKVRVITDIDQIHTFQEGEILVARMTDPTWYPLFSQARGIVTEVGGWLSHAAIVAREYDLPAIVGVPGVCQRLNTGDIIRMSLTGSVEILQERRAPGSALRGNATPASPQSAAATSEAATGSMQAGTAEDATAKSINVYQLTSRKMFRYQQSIERRAMKDQVGDRRARPRLTASGDVERDRRAINREANAQTLRKAG